MTKLITIGLIVGGFIVALVWDIIAAIEPTPGDTISKVALEAFQDHPATGWIAGGLLGHMCSPLRPYFPGWWLWMSIPLLALITSVVIAGDFLGWLDDVTYPPIYILSAFVLAHLCWPQ